MSDQQIFARPARRLIPFLGFLYLVSIVDRLNVGFAALSMNADLGFSPGVFGLGAGIFFLGYMLFQIPSSLILERLGARRWIFCMLAAWGPLSAATAFVEGPFGFYILRFLLGVAEAGLFPGIVLYLTYWFPEGYRARHVAGFMAASPFAFIAGGPIAGALLQMDGIGGFHGWQWLFLIEGLPALLLGIVVLAWLPDRPGDAGWLSASEKTAIVSRLSRERPAEEAAPDFLRTLKDPRIQALALAYLAVGAGGYGIRLWLPQIVQGMGFSNLATGFVVALPYLVAMWAMVQWGKSSDRRDERLWHSVAAVLLAAFGFVLAGASASDFVVFTGLTLVVLGLDAVIGPFWALPVSFLQGRAAAAGIAIVNTVGTGLGGFIGPFAIGTIKDMTGSYAGSMLALAIGLLASSFILLASRNMLAPPASNGRI